MLFGRDSNNLTFHDQNGTFNYRVAAVIRRDGRVLLHRAGSDDFWALPGGRPHQFESATAALRRELYDETGEIVAIGELRAIIEVHFAQTHELDLCFDASLPTGSRLGDLAAEHPGDEEGIPLVFRWINADELRTLRLLPRPVAAMLTSRPDRCGYWFDDERAEVSGVLDDGERNQHVAINHRFETADECRSAGIAYHLTPAEVWERQKESGRYLPEAFEQDGFIHTTNGLRPLLEVANLFYRGDPRSYRVLVLSLPELNAAVRYDDDNQIYPHIYGPLNASAVVGELPVRRAQDGAFLGFE